MADAGMSDGLQQFGTALLPEADFTMASSDGEEEEEGEEGEGVSVFTRRALLQSMGISDSDAPGPVTIATSIPPDNSTTSVTVSSDKPETSKDSGGTNEPLPTTVSSDAMSQTHTEKHSPCLTMEHSDGSHTDTTSTTAEVDWERFKTDFTSSLQSLELDSVVMTTDRSVHVPEGCSEGDSYRHQLLIDTILSLHSDERSHDSETSFADQDGGLRSSTSSDDVISEEGAKGISPVAGGVNSLSSSGGVNSVSSCGGVNSSSGWLRSSVLSLGTLETIHEAELDRVLDSVSPPSIEDVATGVDSDSVPLESRSFPIPAVAWNEAIVGEDLLGQLERLRSGSLQSATAEALLAQDADSSPLPLSHAPLEDPDQAATVFVDLREGDGYHGSSKGGVVSEPSLAARRLMSAWKSHDDSSSDDATEEDDAYSWLKQRTLLTTPSSSSTSSHPHHLHHSHKPLPTLTRSQVATAKPPITSHDQSVGSHDHNVRTAELSKPKTTEKLNGIEIDDSGKFSSKQSVPTLTAPGTGSALQVANPPSLTEGRGGGGERNGGLKTSSKLRHKQNHADPKMGSLKQRNGDGVDHMTSGGDHVTRQVDHMIIKVSSSSSLSEEDTHTTSTSKTSPFKPAALRLSSAEEGRGKGESPSLSETPPSSPSKPPSGGKKKASKKSKKKNKSSQALEDRSHKRRQRRRSDSLTTSSDEEHTTLPPHPSSSSSLPPPSPSPLSFGEDLGAMKEHLKRRIFSRKPPALFETPATEPVYHEDASFSPVMPKLDPTLKTSAILVLPLSDACLLQLPDSLPEPDVAALKALHCLLLTWLAGEICSGSRNGNGDSENESIENGNLGNGDTGNGEIVESSGSDVFSTPNGVMETGNSWNGSLEACDSKTQTLPFKISGLQQTILDGNPAILVAIATTPPRTSRLNSTNSDINSSAAPPPDGCRNDTILTELEAYLKSTPLSTLLADTLSAVQHTLPQAVCEDIQPFLSLPLEEFFSVQDDLSPLKSPVSFYWHSLYHASLLPVDQALRSQTSLQTTVCTLSPGEGLASPLLVYSTLCSVFERGLELVGLRVVFGQCSTLVDSLVQSAKPTDHTWSTNQPLSFRTTNTVATQLSQDSNNTASTLPLSYQSPPSSSSSSCSSSLFDPANPSPLPLLHPPTLALAIRGPDAIFRWMEAVGPEDSVLARITDPASLSARFGGGGMESDDDRGTRGAIPTCVRTPYRAQMAVARWFGGRACLKSGSVLGISDAHTKSERRKRQRVRFSETQSESEDGLSSPVIADVTFTPLVLNRTTLIVPRYSRVLLVMSPHVPASCYSAVMTTCSTMGYDIFGVKRLRLNTKRATALQISSKFVAHFTPSSTPPSPSGVEFVTHPLVTEHAQTSVAPPPSVLFLLGRENAQTHSRVLITAAKHRLDDFLKLTDEGNRLQSISEECLFQATDLTEEASRTVGSFSLPLSVTSSPIQLDSAWEVPDKLREDIGFLAVTQTSSIEKATSILEEIFDVHSSVTFEDEEFTTFHSCRNTSEDTPEKKDFERFELLGFKIIPQLPRFHSKQLCPIPASDGTLYQQGVQLLSDAPATLMVLRGIGCNDRLSRLTLDKPSLHSSTSAIKQTLSCIASQNLREAYRLSGIFFSDKELFTDLKRRLLANDIPYSWQQDSAILAGFTVEPPALFSVFSVDSREIKFCLRVLERVSRSGFEIVAMANVESSNEDEEGVFESAESSQSCLVVCVRRENAVWRLRQSLAPLTPGRHRLTCSESFSSAVADVRRYFPEGVCCPATSITTQFEIRLLPVDDFTGFVRCKIAKFVDSTGYTSPFMETTCAILPPSLTSGGVASGGGVASRGGMVSAPFVEVLEMLVQAGFVLCRMKMALLSRETAEQLCRMIVCTSTRTNAEGLTFGPCLLLLLQRDNAAACFSTVLKSAMQSRLHGNALSNMEELMSRMLVPQSTQEVQKLMKFFSVEVER